ncbi:hypothetical protein EST62_07445 [Chlorobaculum sp. 24CR]|uniref:Spy/CpxP family protein refolding chaperone n=1 Tax=Chlorobaculum sp. 24CR TaxID=2508878 RepID=UPI00100AFD20|nr:hypothetical protein [Chlorobaculum sp. 24CR]RXK85115.1 hypothetical protein EST62_07445 [Chlorobaculum sp. 24CR]
MKKNLLVTALIAGLLGSAGTAFAANNTQSAPCAQPGAARPVDGSAAYDRPGYGRGPDARFARQDMRQDMRQNMRQKIRQSLDLSDSQEAKMIELRRDFYQESRPVRQSLRSLKREVALESVKQSPDKRRIARLTQSIGREHVRLAQLESRHLRKLATVLNARQIDKLLQMKAQFGDHFRGNPRMKG